MTKARDIASAAPAPSTVSATELGYLDGVTSAVQTQLDGKQAANAAVSTTELGYLDGVTSAIQTQLDGKIAKTLTTTTGDLIYASSANTPARLGIGSASQVLTVSGGVPSWATPSSGGSLTLLSTTTLSGASTAISSISSSYTDLRFELLGYSTTGNAGCEWRPNGSTTIMSWSGTQNGAFGNADGQPLWVEMGGNGGQNDNSLFVANLYIYRYTNTSNYKNFIYTFGSWTRNTGTVYFGGCQGVVKTNSAISSMTLALSGNSFSAGTVKTYGVN